MTLLRFGLVLGVLLPSATLTASPQEPTVTYRSEVNVIEWICAYYGPDGPITDFTAVNFSVTIDKKVPVDVTVVQKNPGSYHVYFSPPDKLRDGRKHRVDVTVLNVLPKGKPWKMRATNIVFPNAAAK